MVMIFINQIKKPVFADRLCNQKFPIGQRVNDVLNIWRLIETTLVFWAALITACDPLS